MSILSGLFKFPMFCRSHVFVLLNAMFETEMVFSALFFITLADTKPRICFLVLTMTGN